MLLQLKSSHLFEVVISMGGGTFFKVGGGPSARQKNYGNFLWFEQATVTSQTPQKKVGGAWFRNVRALVGLSFPNQKCCVYW